MIDLQAPYEEQDQDGIFRLQPPAIFAGQMTRPLAIRAAGPIEIVAIRFEPDGARDWLGHSMHLATDRRLDVVERTAALRAHLLGASGDPAAQVETAAAWLVDQHRQGRWQIDAMVRAAIEALLPEPHAEPNAEPRAAAQAPASTRTLQRRFMDRVGISPRMLRSVMRFRRVFDHAEDLGWLQAGLTAGYFDQPQMARDFRRFLGCPATSWAREQVELARRIASEPSHQP